MTDKIVVDLLDNLVVNKTDNNNSFQFAGDNIPDKKLNIALIKSAFNYINKYGKEDYNNAMIGMMLLSNKYSEVFNDANNSIINTLNILNTDSTNQNLSAFGSLSNIGSGVDKAVSSISTGYSSVTNMATQFDPTNFSNWADMAKSLAKFLMCPEASFLGDLVNGFKDIVDSVKSFRPSQLLNDITNNLTNYIMGFIPSTNTLLDFVKNVASYVGINGADIDLLISTVGSILSMNGLNISYLRNIPLLSNIVDYLDPASAINKIRSQINNSGTFNYLDNIFSNSVFPTDIDTIRCSHLAKIIQQLSNSYRTNNRYDDLNIFSSMVPNTSNSSLNSLLSNYSNYNNRSNIASNNIKNAISLGNSGKTTLNTSLSALVLNGNIMKSTIDNFNKVNENQASYTVAKIGAINNLNNLKQVNNFELTKQKAFREGLSNIQRSSNFLNLSNFV